MIERLMNRTLYQKDPQTNKYNASYLTKLVRNYRSHPAIIQASNKMFYDNELESCAPECKNNQNKLIITAFSFNIFFCLARTHCFLKWKLLPSFNSPIIFEVLCSTASKSRGSTR